MQELYTQPEVSELTGVPIGTLKYWRHCGVGPHSFKLGPKRVVYRKEDVMSWMQAQYDRGVGDPIGAS